MGNFGFGVASSAALHATAPLDMPDSGTALPAMSPDALLAYCQTRMQGIDAQMHGYFAQQERANSDSEAINKALEVMNKYGGGTGGAADVEKADEELKSALEVAREATGGDTPVAHKLQKVLCDLRAVGDCAGHPDGVSGGAGKISKEQMDGFIKCVRDVQTDINADGQLNMINLQSIMAQRQTTLQMTTNLVQSLGEQSKMIAGNIGK